MHSCCRRATLKLSCKTSMLVISCEFSCYSFLFGSLTWHINLSSRRRDGTWISRWSVIISLVVRRQYCLLLRPAVHDTVTGCQGLSTMHCPSVTALRQRTATQLFISGPRVVGLTVNCRRHLYTAFLRLVKEFNEITYLFSLRIGPVSTRWSTELGVIMLRPSDTQVYALSKSKRCAR